MKPRSIPREILESEDEKLCLHLNRKLIASLMQLVMWTGPHCKGPRSTSDSVVFISSEQGGTVNNSSMLKAAENLQLLTSPDMRYMARKHQTQALSTFLSSRNRKGSEFRLWNDSEMIYLTSTNL